MAVANFNLPFLYVCMLRLVSSLLKVKISFVCSVGVVVLVELIYCL